MKAGLQYGGIMLLVSVAACQQKQTPATATADLCGEIAELATYMERTRLTDSTTVGQVQEYREQVADHVRDIRKEAGQVQEERVRALEEANRRLEQKVDRLSPNLPVGAAADSIRTEVSAVGAARAALNSDVQCVVQAGQ